MSQAKLLLMAAALALAAGCDNLPGKPKPDERPQRPDKQLSFQPLFAAHCSGCHGAAGKLGPAPPLNDPLFLAIASDADLTQIITTGRPGTLMPAFDRRYPGGTLTAEQIQALVKGLRETWGKDKPKLEAALPSYAVAKDAKPGDVAAGKKVFAAACAMCHGTEGQGTESAGAINNRAFLDLLSDQALRRIIITGREDLKMPNFADPLGRPGDFQPLTNQNVTDVMALLQSWRAKK